MTVDLFLIGLPGFTTFLLWALGFSTTDFILSLRDSEPSFLNDFVLLFRSKKPVALRDFSGLTNEKFLWMVDFLAE